MAYMCGHVSSLCALAGGGFMRVTAKDCPQWPVLAPFHQPCPLLSFTIGTGFSGPVIWLPVHQAGQLTDGRCVCVCVRAHARAGWEGCLRTWNPEVAHLLYAWELQGAGLWPWFPWQWATSFAVCSSLDQLIVMRLGALGQRQRMGRSHHQTL